MPGAWGRIMDRVLPGSQYSATGERQNVGAGVAGLAAKMAAGMFGGPLAGAAAGRVIGNGIDGKPLMGTGPLAHLFGMGQPQMSQQTVEQPQMQQQGYNIPMMGMGQANLGLGQQGMQGGMQTGGMQGGQMGGGVPYGGFGAFNPMASFGHQSYNPAGGYGSFTPQMGGYNLGLPSALQPTTGWHADDDVAKFVN